MLLLSVQSGAAQNQIRRKFVRALVRTCDFLTTTLSPGAFGAPCLGAAGWWISRRQIDLHGFREMSMKLKVFFLIITKEAEAYNKNEAA